MASPFRIYMYSFLFFYRNFRFYRRKQFIKIEKKGATCRLLLSDTAQSFLISRACIVAVSAIKFPGEGI